jgi:CHAD domain-containing protein
MATASTMTGSRPEHRGLLYWMERVLKELDHVCTAPDADAVHDLRVALRRCRSVAAVMEEVDPDRSWQEMRKLGKKLFRQLGELRDTQILEDWTKKLGTEQEPIRQRLLSGLEKKETELRQAALKVAGKFDQRAWRKLERTLAHRVRAVPVDGLAAECLGLERLEAAKELHAQALRTDKPEHWHALRIGVKRFRYTVESLLPQHYGVWGDNLKHVQDLLGDVHDLDVLSATVAQVASTESEEARAAWAERIWCERHERLEDYRQLTHGSGNLWQVWRSELPQRSRLETAAMARIRATARALNGNARRAAQVARLTTYLYDGVTRAHAAPLFAEKRLRKIMRAAAQIHGIGRALNSDAPQKAARNFLHDMPIPPAWTEDEWELLSNVVRYHRGKLPKAKQKAFARLTPQQQKAVCMLAGVLRLARALRKCGVESGSGLRVEKSVDALIVHVPGLQDTEETVTRLAAGKYLLESTLERPLILKPAPAVLKVVELPKKKEEIQQPSAAASD